MGAATTINAIVDDVKADLTASATALGLVWSTSMRIYERDEHPQAALNRNDLPCAYIIPIMEGGDFITDYLDDTPRLHNFPITVVAYYLGNDVTATQLGTDLRTYRNYAYAFVDYYKTKTNGNYLSGGGWIKDWKVDVGYWISGGGQVVHFWIVKMNVTCFST